jgi:hypothetical protein
MVVEPLERVYPGLPGSGMLKALEPWSRGGLYLNFPGGGNVPEDLVAEAFGAKVERLARVKAEHDPGNMFRTNLNIAPKR